MAKPTKQLKPILKPKKRIDKIVILTMAVGSIALGAYLLHNILASGGDLSDAQQEVGYNVPLAVAEKPTGNIPLLAITAGLMIATPVVGAAIIIARRRNS